MQYEVSIIVAFWAGVLSFISPCVLPLVPAYIARLSGATISAEGQTAAQRAHTFFHALAFVVGFSLVFVVLGVSVGLMGQVIQRYMVLLRQIGGLALVVLGLNVAGVLKIPWLYSEKKVHYRPGARASYLASFLVGVVFSLGWTPCVGPILAAILLYASASQTVLQGAILLVAYALGLGIPFLITGLALTTVSDYLQKLNRHMGLVSLISGVLLVLMGILIFTNSLAQLSQYFSFFNFGQG